MKDLKQLYKADPERTDALLTKIVVERLDELQFESIVEENEIYQEYKARYQRLAEQCTAPEAGQEVLAECEETLNYIQFIRENAAYMQGLKDGLALSAFGIGNARIKLYGSDIYKFSGLDSADKAKGDGISERNAS